MEGAEKSVCWICCIEFRNDAFYHSDLQMSHACKIFKLQLPVKIAT